MHLLCEKCQRAHRSLQGTAHQCKTCTLNTYSAFTYCVCCAIEKDQCQACGTVMNTGRDDAAVKEVESARAVYLEAAKSIEAEFDASIADIRSEIDTWLKVNKDSAAAYEAAMKPFQDAYQTAAQALQVLQSSGAAADSDAVVAAKKSVDEANTALRDAMPSVQKLLWDPINEERVRIGEDKLKRHEDAWRASDKKKRKAERRFELVAERIAGHLGVDAAYKMQLEQLDQQFA